MSLSVGTVSPIVDNMDLGSGSQIGNTRRPGDSHQGLDVFAPAGSPIYSTISGEIVRLGFNSLGGYRVTVRDSQGNTHYFAHMDPKSQSLWGTFNFTVGTKVTAGQQIGLVGTSGNAAGSSPHVHYSINEDSSSMQLYDPYVFLSSSTLSAPTSTSMGGAEESIRVGDVQYDIYTIQGEGTSARVFFQNPNPGEATGDTKSYSQEQWDAYVLQQGLFDAGVVDASSEFGGQSFSDVMMNTMFTMGIAGSDALSDPGVMQIVALAMTRDMEPVELANRLRMTAWWDEHTDLQRSWNDKSSAQQNLEIVDQASALIGLWFTYVGQSQNIMDYDLDGDGTVTAKELSATNPNLYNNALAVVSGVKTQPQVINEWLKPEAEANPESPWNRILRRETQEQGQFQVDVESQAQGVMSLYQSMGIDMNWDQALGLGQKIAMNEMSMAEITQSVDTMAQQLYGKPVGVSTMQWASPYLQTWSALMEEASPGLSPTILSALQDGQSISDFKRQIRGTEEWKGTDNARDEYMNKFSSVSRIFGF
jgi:hypothetical protein